ncbi:MAG: hypothetical protein ACI4XF_00515 [Oscillospiraceae bacterium]
MKLRIEDLTTVQKCRHPTVGTILSSCFEYSAELDTGINFISGDVFDEGWICSYALSKGKLSAVQEGRFYLDGMPISLKDLRKMTYYVSYDERTVFSRMKFRAMLKLFGSRSITESKLVRCFGLEEFILDRQFRCLGHWHYLCSCIIGILKGKKILCFPWLHSGEVALQTYRFRFLSRFAEKNGIIVLIPTAEIRDYEKAYIECPYNHIGYKFADNGERILFCCSVRHAEKDGTTSRSPRCE